MANSEWPCVKRQSELCDMIFSSTGFLLLVILLALALSNALYVYLEKKAQNMQVIDYLEAHSNCSQRKWSHQYSPHSSSHPTTLGMLSHDDL